MNQLDFETIKPILKDNDVEYAAVFGSYARGEEKPDSDVDILVRLKKPKSFIELGRMEDKLSEILSRKTDLVTERALSPHIKDYVMKDMRMIYGSR